VIDTASKDDLLLDLDECELDIGMEGLRTSRNNVKKKVKVNFAKYASK